MANVAEGPADRVPWSSLRRYNVHRTSKPTNDAVRYLRDQVSVLRGSTHRTENSADLVIFAALRIIMRGELRDLADEVGAVLSGTYVPAAPHDPGE